MAAPHQRRTGDRRRHGGAPLRAHAPGPPHRRGVRGRREHLVGRPVRAGPHGRGRVSRGGRRPGAALGGDQRRSVRGAEPRRLRARGRGARGLAAPPPHVRRVVRRVRQARRRPGDLPLRARRREPTPGTGGRPRAAPAGRHRAERGRHERALARRRPGRPPRPGAGRRHVARTGRGHGERRPRHPPVDRPRPPGGRVLGHGAPARRGSAAGGGPRADAPALEHGTRRTQGHGQRSGRAGATDRPATAVGGGRGRGAAHPGGRGPAARRGGAVARGA